MRLPQVTAGTLLRLLVASLVVGMVMALLGLTPGDVVRYATGFAGDIAQNAAAWVSSALSYILLGAAIVIPIWLVATLFKTFGRR